MNDKYSGKQDWGVLNDLVVPDVTPKDERLWTPFGEGMFSRPLLLNTSLGYYVHLLRVTKAGMVSRHRHSGPVHAQVIKGEWFYLEHEWTAQEGAYIFEPPGEIHTLMVSEKCEEMLTIFTVFGALIYVDDEGNTTGYDDVFTRMEKYRQHYADCGLGVDFVEQFVR